MMYQDIKEDSIKFMVYLSGKSPTEIAQNMGISERTFYRYMRPDFVGNRLPILMATGNLGAIDSRWENWRLSKGKLITPSKETLHPSEISAIYYLKNLAFGRLGVMKSMALMSPAANDSVIIKKVGTLTTIKSQKHGLLVGHKIKSDFVTF